MELTNEEKELILEKIGKVAAAFSAFQVSRDRLRAMNSVSKVLLSFNLDDGAMDRAVWNYENAYSDALKELYTAIGIEGPQDEFWKWLDAKKAAAKKDEPPE